MVSFDEFGDPIALTGVERDLYETDAAFAGSATTTTTTTKPSRTWGEWVQYKMTAPFESTLTAVGVSYWIANMLSAGVNSRVSILSFVCTSFSLNGTLRLTVRIFHLRWVCSMMPLILTCFPFFVSCLFMQLKAPPKPKGYMEYFMALYQSGFEGKNCSFSSQFHHTLHCTH